MPKSGALDGKRTRSIGTNFIDDAHIAIVGGVENQQP